MSAQKVKIDTYVNHLKCTVQAIRNITNFRAKNSYEFVRIRTNFVLKFVHEFMPEDYVFIISIT